MIYLVFHEELKWVKYKVLMKKCWASHCGMQTEANLVLIKDQVWFYQVDLLRLLGIVAMRVQGMERVSLWVIRREPGLEIN